MSTERPVGTVKVEFASKRTAVVALMGEHDLDSRAALRATLAYAGESRNLLVDLRKCTFADSTTISLLLATQRALKARDRRLDLILPHEPCYVGRVFELTGIASMFTLHPSRSAGLAGLEEFALLAKPASSMTT